MKTWQIQCMYFFFLPWSNPDQLGGKGCDAHAIHVEYLEYLGRDSWPLIVELWCTSLSQFEYLVNLVSVFGLLFYIQLDAKKQDPCQTLMAFTSDSFVPLPNHPKPIETACLITMFNSQKIGQKEVRKTGGACKNYPEIYLSTVEFQSVDIFRQVNPV